MRKFVAFIVLALALTACGGGGTSASEESFVSGDGSTTSSRFQIERLHLQLLE
jgi:ABC-type glycerol-3-phosphate transport system substrate-binding protein